MTENLIANTARYLIDQGLDKSDIDKVNKIIKKI